MKLAGRYHANLERKKGVTRPPISPTALSHYSVRLNPVLRNVVKDRLYKAGIYAVTFWTFLPYLDKTRFPNAYRLSCEVLNLPLAPWMSTDDVDRVCEVLIGCVEGCSREAVSH